LEQIIFKWFFIPTFAYISFSANDKVIGLKFLIFIVVLLFSFTNCKGQGFGDNNTVEEVGDVLQIALPAIAFSIELLRNDKEGMFQFVKAFGVNFLAIHITKRIINKPRPKGGNHAFPSGHTAAAFQAASFIHKRYGFQWGIPAYLGAAFVGYSRDKGKNNRHDMWDVAGGAVLGSAISFIFAKKANSKKVKVYSYPLDGGMALEIKYNF
jgi:membrane-associated phospholipid phosphatase